MFTQIGIIFANVAELFNIHDFTQFADIQNVHTT